MTFTEFIMASAGAYPLMWAYMAAIIVFIAIMAVREGRNDG